MRRIPCRAARGGIRAGVCLATAVVVSFAALAGCARTQPVPASAPPTPAPPTTSAPNEDVQPSGTPSATQPARTQPEQTFVSAPMPWPGDDSPMLWQIVRNNGAAGRDGESGASFLGFVDKTGKEVQPPKYVSFDYCLQNKRPTRVVAARDDAIDVIGLDGAVTRTIKISAKADQLEGAWLWCRDNKTVAVTLEGWQEFDLSTGAKIKTSLQNDDNCKPVGVEAPPDPPLPSGYPQYVDGGWASNETDGRPVREFVNLETKATVRASADESYCWGIEGYLRCEGRLVPTVYDKSGKLTDFSSVDDLGMGMCNDVRVAASPYLWATSGRVEGYIDKSSGWRFQQSLYIHAGD